MVKCSSSYWPEEELSTQCWATTSAHESYSTIYSGPMAAVVGTTRVIHLPRENAVYVPNVGRVTQIEIDAQASARVRELARMAAGMRNSVTAKPPEPSDVDNSSPMARALLNKGLQKAVEETMAFERGLGHMAAPWEG